MTNDDAPTDALNLARTLIGPDDRSAPSPRDRAAAFRMLRAYRGLTLPDLAERTGIDGRTLAEYEDFGEIPDDQLDALLGALELPEWVWADATSLSAWLRAIDSMRARDRDPEAPFASLRDEIHQIARQTGLDQERVTRRLLGTFSALMASPRRRGEP